MASSTEQADLRLVEAVEMRFALAATGPQLSAQLTALLGPLLRKLLSSKFHKVHSRIVSVCSELTPRIRALNDVKLPVNDLIDVFFSITPVSSTASNAILTSSLTLIYIDIGFSRITSEERSYYLPLILKSISCRSVASQASLFNLFVQYFSQYKPPSIGFLPSDIPPKKETDSTEEATSQLTLTSFFNENLEDTQWILEQISQFMLLDPSFCVSQVSSSTNENNVQQLFLSDDQLRILTNNGRASFLALPSDLLNTMTSLLNAIYRTPNDSSINQIFDHLIFESDKVCSFKRFKAALFASTSSSYNVVKLSIEIMKRHATPSNMIEYYRTELVGIYTKFLKSENAFISPEIKDNIGKSVIQWLSKIGITTNSEDILLIYNDILRDILKSTSSSYKLKVSALKYLLKIVRLADIEKDNAIKSFFNTIVEDLKTSLFEANLDDTAMIVDTKLASDNDINLVFRIEVDILEIILRRKPDVINRIGSLIPILFESLNQVVNMQFDDAKKIDLKSSIIQSIKDLITQIASTYFTTDETEIENLLSICRKSCESDNILIICIVFAFLGGKLFKDSIITAQLAIKYLDHENHSVRHAASQRLSLAKLENTTDFSPDLYMDRIAGLAVTIKELISRDRMVHDRTGVSKHEEAQIVIAFKYFFTQILWVGSKGKVEFKLVEGITNIYHDSDEVDSKDVEINCGIESNRVLGIFKEPEVHEQIQSFVYKLFTSCTTNSGVMNYLGNQTILELYLDSIKEGLSIDNQVIQEQLMLVLKYIIKILYHKIDNIEVNEIDRSLKIFYNTFKTIVLTLATTSIRFDTRKSAASILESIISGLTIKDVNLVNISDDFAPLFQFIKSEEDWNLYKQLKPSGNGSSIAEKLSGVLLITSHILSVIYKPGANKLLIDEFESVVKGFDISSYIDLIVKQIEDISKESGNSLPAALSEIILNSSLVSLAAILKSTVLSGKEWTRPKIKDLMYTLTNKYVESNRKVSEVALANIGYILTGLFAFTDLSKDNASALKDFEDISTSIIELLPKFASNFSKNIELHFSVGELLADVIYGFTSEHLSHDLDGFTKQSIVNNYKSSSDLRKLIFKKTVSKISNILGITESSDVDKEKATQLSASLADKRAASVWLLCLTKYDIGTNYVGDEALVIHQMLTKLLAEKDDFVQDISSKTLSLLFETGSQEVKDYLVDSLVSTLIEGRKMNNINNETQLFGEGNSIGTAPDGTQISTYQSILSVAADMNQPDLVYKFMSLASHSAIWNSRKGASIGFGKIVSKAQDELKPHLPRLIPKLYRMQFDPTPKISESMRNVWRSLVTDSSKAMVEYFPNIIEDLLKSISDKQWRVREATCAAIANLVQSRDISAFKEEDLQLIWVSIFRSLDDIKDSVRVQAGKTAKVLIKVTCRNIDPESGTSPKTASNLLKVVIPFLLEKGITSSVDEVKSYSLKALLDICKFKIPKELITSICISLLEGLSNLEPQSFSYLSFHADKYGVTSTDLEFSRVAVSNQSPMMEGLEKLENQIDSEILPQLIPELTQLIKRGVGLPTRAGCSRFTTSLVTKLSNDVKPYADELLNALESHLTDASPVVRKLAATSIAYVLRIAPKKSSKKYILLATRKYAELDPESPRRNSDAILFKQISHVAMDLAKSYMGEILPLVLVGMHDSDKSTSEIWKLTYEELAITRATVKLYADEVMKYLETTISDNSSWVIKKQVSITLSKFIGYVEGRFEVYGGKTLDLYFDILLGRYWEGKEYSFKAYCETLVLLKDWINNPSRDKYRLKAFKTLDTELKKKVVGSKDYRRIVLDSFHKVVVSFKSEELFDMFNDYFKEYIEELSPKQNSMVEDQVNESNKTKNDDKAHNVQIEATSLLILTDLYMPLPIDKSVQNLSSVFKIIKYNIDQNVWLVRSNALKSLSKILNKLSQLMGITPIDHVSDEKIELSDKLLFDVVSEEEWSDLLNVLLESVKDGKYTVIRSETALCLKSYSNINKNSITKGNEECKALNSKLLNELDPIISRELNDVILQNLKDIKTIL